ncbi:hypothetical protein NCCP2716_26180 [Sporosarcina sp. NCCP-2716]|uniref:hypothetical protein n=1 Tax=Sporosarcina sp. NCCP-2716 TaxID=2943679 RepID=UPI00203E7E65|nr:hypothetical protein [Sporosarcina sp. NCCP-2716]GKV70120.1 hypothetical protein NCCP2716_26180 [Sporosarcina sp. NCCP-2716]
MSSQFELSFKNRAVRMYLYLIIPAVLIQGYLIFFTNIPSIIPAALPTIPLLIFFVWLVLHKKKKEKQAVNE